MMTLRKPARIVVERQVIESYLAQIDVIRRDVEHTITLLETGRTSRAADILRDMLRRVR